MTDKGTQFGILHWGPCVVHTKLQKPILDKLYVAAISSQKSANEELAGVLKEQIHIKDKEQFGDFFNSSGTFRYITNDNAPPCECGGLNSSFF